MQNPNNQTLIFKINSKENIDEMVTSGLTKIFKLNGYFLNEIDEDSRDHHVCLNINDSNFMIEIIKPIDTDGNWYVLAPFHRKTTITNWNNLEKNLSTFN